MFVSHRNTGSIVRCESEDGIRWSEPTAVLTCDPASGWEDRVDRASFVVKDGVWYLWYTGMNAERAAIGLATSKDGYHFNRVTQDPILLPDAPHEKNAVMNPCVMWDEENGVFKMWYSAGEKYEPDVLCHATSKDGAVWEKYAGNPVFTHGTEVYDQLKVGGCDIIRCGGRYLQFYIGYENIDNARICTASSGDGIHWLRDSENPILSATENAWDADAVYKPTVCVGTDRVYLWYNGRRGHAECIGLATKYLSDT